MSSLFLFLVLSLFGPSRSEPELPYLVAGILSSSSNHFWYKGWEVKWLGWHTALRYKNYFGVYLAKSPKYPDVILYASYPGKRGATTADQAIDSCPTLLKGQHILKLSSTDEELRQAQLLCMRDLIKTIEEYKPK